MARADRIEITTFDDPGPRFLDTKTGAVYDEAGNVWPSFYGRDVLRPEPAAVFRDAMGDPRSGTSWWDWLKAFVKENW